MKFNEILPLVQNESKLARFSEWPSNEYLYQCHGTLTKRSSRENYIPCATELNASTGWNIINEEV